MFAALSAYYTVHITTGATKIPGVCKHILLLKAVIALSFVVSSTLYAQQPIPPIGQWRTHLNQQFTTQVIKGDKRYCATASHVFAVDDAGDIQQYDKATGLTETGVRCIGWDVNSGQLVIAYNNSSLDVLKENRTRNIGDIKRSNVAGNKTINAVYCRNGLAFMSTGLGIIVADLNRYEIKDTWYIGNAGTQVTVNAFSADNNYYYAATVEGLKKLPLSATTPADYAAWQMVSGTAGLSAGPVANVQASGSVVFVQKNDSVFIQSGNSWQLFYTAAGWSVTGMTLSDNKLLVCQRSSTGNARVLVLSGSGSIEKNISSPGIISFPRSAIIDNNMVWVADQFGGLSAHGATAERYIPNGPPGTADGELFFTGDTLYAAAGSVNSSWNYQYNRNGVYWLQNGRWGFYGSLNTPLLDTALDFITVARSRYDQYAWAGSYGGGLLRFEPDGLFTLFKRNTTLQPATGDPGSYRVSGLAFDEAQNLWISNYGAPQNLQLRKKDGSWKGFSIPFALTENAVSQIIADPYNQLWIVSPKGNGLICYQPGADVERIQDDKWKLYRQGAGNGNLPDNNVLCITQDKNNFIWVGTERGIGIIQCTDQVFTGNCEALLPVVQQNGFNGLLFRDEQVQSIAVDGANRKWVGTKNGAWLVSPDGMRIVYRFTEDNSPLLGNDVKKIAVNPVTGEVFFATANGMCSFRSTATEAAEQTGNILVFPNPVPPGYNGTIAIRGLPENALVKIAELNGTLVHQGRALGGQFAWNGRNYNGAKAASGVYLVLVRDDAGKEQLATKIVIVSGR